jgi:hypothetical protein
MTKAITQRKQNKHLRRNVSYKKNGGMWPFNNDKKEEQKFTEVVPSTPSQKKINYNEVSISYKNNRISCDVCKKDKFYTIDMSISRSKVASGFAGVILGDGISDLIEHPVKCYLCTTCLSCRFVYANTLWNGTKAAIIPSDYK